MKMTIFSIVNLLNHLILVVSIDQIMNNVDAFVKFIKLNDKKNGNFKLSYYVKVNLQLWL